MPLFFRLSYMSSLHTFRRRSGLMTECCYSRIHQLSVGMGCPGLKVLLWPAHENQNAAKVTELVLLRVKVKRKEWKVFNIARCTWAFELENDQLYKSPVSRLGAIRSESNIHHVEPKCHLATICRSNEFCNFDPAVGASTTRHTSCCPSSSAHWNAVLVRNLIPR